MGDLDGGGASPLRNSNESLLREGTRSSSRRCGSCGWARNRSCLAYAGCAVARPSSSPRRTPRSAEARSRAVRRALRADERLVGSHVADLGGKVSVEGSEPGPPRGGPSRRVGVRLETERASVAERMVTRERNRVSGKPLARTSHIARAVRLAYLSLLLSACALTGQGSSPDDLTSVGGNEYVIDFDAFVDVAPGATDDVVKDDDPPPAQERARRASRARHRRRRPRRASQPREPDARAPPLTSSPTAPRAMSIACATTITTRRSVEKGRCTGTHRRSDAALRRLRRARARAHPDLLATTRPPTATRSGTTTSRTSRPAKRRSSPSSARSITTAQR